MGKTTRPLKYDLNQIPYNYTVEVTNRFRGLDLIDREPAELQVELTTREVVVPRTSPKEKMEKGKMVV